MNHTVTHLRFAPLASEQFPTNMAQNFTENYHDLDETEMEEDNDEEQNWEDWKVEEDGDSEEDNLDPELICLFCVSMYSSCDELFQHCSSTHHFDFQSIKKNLGLDFYGCFKLINYIRSQVEENRCWSCSLACKSKPDLESHLHQTVSFKESTVPWDDDKYLKPFLQDDPLLYSFGDNDNDYEDEDTTPVNKKERIRDVNGFEQICFDDECDLKSYAPECTTSFEKGMEEVALAPDSCLDKKQIPEKILFDRNAAEGDDFPSDGKLEDKQSRVPFSKIVEDGIKRVNKNYFGAYSSFGIHREMISDKVRTDAYRQAIVENPSLLNGAVVMDVGCGTGILSLFAAQSGASRVIAVEASEKMAAVAAQIAKENGLLRSGNPSKCTSPCTGVMEVVQGMVEELGNSKNIKPHSVDVLLSEWMGYCLLYESMLSSVLLARDLWLKPGGAILPDMATMFVAGFGKGGTSIPFWENVYGFNMSCVGKELVEDAARVPIIDIVASQDIVTNSAILQTLDLVTMKSEEVDFTANIELEPKLRTSTNCSDLKPNAIWCYGLVLWFETGFTARFCKEMPTVLSTSPFTPKTHWWQTILTFCEPIAMSSGEVNPAGERLALSVGTDGCPAVKIHSRISIARSPRHRSIDISMEITGIGPDGRKHKWPVQIFNLC